jgi:type IV pilus assembly protein PilQ
MAVGTMLLTNSSYLNVSGPPVTMTLRNAPARDVLMALSRLGGYGFVFIEDSNKADNAAGTNGSASTLPISISFRNENYGQAVNSALLAAGLQGKRQGNTILAGTNVMGKSFGAQLSKVYRLNQVNANSAADYLANLGAQVTKTNTINTAITEGVNPNNTAIGAQNLATTTSSRQTKVESYSAGSGPLQGLIATTDSRLSTITLVGEPRLVTVAESYLRQLDLRQRQVALSVKILDVSLGNNATIDNSFAVRWGNNFIVNDQGQMVGAFNSLLPPRTDAFGRSYPNDVTFEIDEQGRIIAEAPTGINVSGGAQRGTSPYPSQPDASIFKEATKRNPGLAYNRNNFYNFVNATIRSSNTKVLASPTLILSENAEELRKGEDTLALNIANLSSGGSGNNSSSSGSSGSDNNATIGRTKANESFVTVGEQVITNYTVTTGTQGNGNSCQPQFGIAGLTFGARVSKIDDNGFVTFSMSPAISATVRQFPVQGCGPIDILAIRRLDTGSARVRDGQTLILTGVISDRDTEVVTKWPILGDIPIIGQFFRNSGSNRAKRELVILVTPRIIDDTQGGSWGYGYQPSTRESRRFLGTSNGQSPY